MDNCCISCQVMADMKKVYDDLIIINLYQKQKFSVKWLHHKISYIIFGCESSILETQKYVGS